MRHLILLILLSLTGVALAQKAEYQGPTILSRGTGAIVAGGGELVRLRPFVNLNAIYDTNLTPVSVNEQGEIPQTDGYGVEAAFGVYGYHSWKKTLLGLDYRGDFRHYTQKTYYDGTDHFLTLGVTHQASRRVSVTLRESAGTYARSFWDLSAAGFFNPNLANTPSNELFDSRTSYLSTMGDLTFQKSRRLSFNVGGGGLIVRRRSSQLIGVTGWDARGDMAYRLNQSNVIGFDYVFDHYDFTRAFGASDVHTAAFDWSARLGRYWSFSLRAGGSRVEALGLRYVAIDPVIAAIIGQTTGIEVFYALNYVPSGEARLTRVFRRSSLSFFYNRGVTPGNGVYLTSQAQSAGASVSHTASRKWNVGLDAGYDSFRSLGQTLGRYHSYRAGTGITYQMREAFHLVARFDARKYDISDSTLRRDQYRASLGFAFSPGDFPLSLW